MPLDKSERMVFQKRLIILTFIFTIFNQLDFRLLEEINNYCRATVIFAIFLVIAVSTFKSGSCIYFILALKVLHVHMQANHFSFFLEVCITCLFSCMQRLVCLIRCSDHVRQLKLWTW